MAKSKVTDVTVKLYDLLEPLAADERQRVINAAYALLGDAIATPPRNTVRDNTAGNEENDVRSGARLPAVRAWMKQNEITEDQLAQIFHFDVDTVDVIAAQIPGNKNTEKTPNAYVIAGLAAFLKDGIGKIEDKGARALCNTLGCFDRPNHAAILKNNLGNNFTGDKSKGWTLTVPGRKRAAEIVKLMVKQG